MAVPKKNQDDEFQGLPPLVQRYLERLLEEPDDPLELGTVYDIIWRYLREQNALVLNGPEIEEVDLFKQSSALKELVDFLFENLNLSPRRHARLNEATIRACSQAESHYTAAIETNPSAVLPRKRLAFMSLTRNHFYDAVVKWEELYDSVGFEGGPHAQVWPRVFNEYSSVYTLAPLHQFEPQDWDEETLTQVNRALCSDGQVLQAAGWSLAGVEDYVRDHPDDENGYLELHRQYELRAPIKACSQLGCSQLGLAFKTLEDAVRDHPEFTEARKALARHRYFWKGEWVKAIQELEELKDCLPEDPSVIVPLINLYEELGMIEEAKSLWQSLLTQSLFAGLDSSEQDFHHVSEIQGSRNSVYSVRNVVVDFLGSRFAVNAKIFPDLPEVRSVDGRVIEHVMIETFRDIAGRHPEFGLLHSLPTVRYPYNDPSSLGACLVTETVEGKTLDCWGESIIREHLPPAVRLLAAIHAASLEFSESKFSGAVLTDVVAEREDFFEQRLRSIFFGSCSFSPPPEKSVVESFISYYGPISSVLKSQPRCYYKDANLKNWVYSPQGGTLTAIDFERDLILPPQLDLVSLLEFGSAYLDNEEIDGMLQTYHSSFCEFSHQDIPLSDFMGAYPYAAVQRHLELIGYRKRDSASSQDPKELQRLKKEIDYHANRALNYLTHLAEKHSGTETEKEDILELVKLLPQLLPSLSGSGCSKIGIDDATETSKTESSGFEVNDGVTLEDLDVGSLAKAKGGYYMVELKDLLTSPGVWDELKATLESGKVKIQGSKDGYIGLGDVTFVLLGGGVVDSCLRKYFSEVEFLDKHFKMNINLDDRVDVTDESIGKVFGYITKAVRDEELRPFDSSAVNTAAGYLIRMSGDQGKFSLDLGQGGLTGILIEADDVAKLAGREVVTGDDVQAALDRRYYRIVALDDRYREFYRDDLVTLDLEGKRIGEAYALPVYTKAGIMFCVPAKVAVITSASEEGAIDILVGENLPAKAYQGGTNEIASYMRHIFEQDSRISYEAKIIEEEQHSALDGNSNSALDLVMLLSQLSEVPILQRRTIVGDISQTGQLMMVGAATSRVEGFYEACKKTGILDKYDDTGVVIPHQNAKNLQLKPEVVKAIEEGKFHVWVTDRIEGAVEILTDVRHGATYNAETGTAALTGEEDTVYFKAAEKLKHYTEMARK